MATSAITHHANARLMRAYETLSSRVRSIRANSEKTIDRAVTLGASTVAAGGFGFLNEMYGKAPENDPSGYPEHTLLGVPSDAAAGGVLAAAAMFGLAGKYEHLVISLASGSLNAFSYRFGAEQGRKRKASGGGHPAATKTSGYATPWGPR